MSTTTIYPIALPVLAVFVTGILILVQKWRQWDASSSSSSSSSSSAKSLASTTTKVDDVKSVQGDAYQDIEPLYDFDLDATPPIRIRPFKPKYHLTMALENITLSDLFLMDQTYVPRTQLRQQVLRDHTDQTLQCNPCAEGAVKEFYEWVTGVYLPKRYPTVFKILPGYDGLAARLRNTVTGKDLPLESPSGREALRSLGENVDTEFLFLLPSSTAVDGSPVYHLQAFTLCFPTGFSPLEKLGLPLAEIHTPVPSYAERLEKSMDRFFAKIECGRAIKRVNWSITTNNGALFSPHGNHMYADGSVSAIKDKADPKTLDVSDPNLVESIEQQKKDIVLDACRLRCERQTLHRLQHSKALVFAFKTYQYRLDEIKAEGNGVALADAIEGLGEGNAPGMKYYKRGVVWGDKVVEFLRS